MKDYLADFLAETLEIEHKLVTTALLSSLYCISQEEATSTLKDYIASRPVNNEVTSLTAWYLITGPKANSQTRHFEIVSEANLDSAKRSYTGAANHSLYGLHCGDAKSFRTLWAYSNLAANEGRKPRIVNASHSVAPMPERICGVVAAGASQHAAPCSVKVKEIVGNGKVSGCEPGGKANSRELLEKAKKLPSTQHGVVQVEKREESKMGIVPKQADGKAPPDFVKVDRRRDTETDKKQSADSKEKEEKVKDSRRDKGPGSKPSAGSQEKEEKVKDDRLQLGHKNGKMSKATSNERCSLAYASSVGDEHEVVPNGDETSPRGFLRSKTTAKKRRRAVVEDSDEGDSAELHTAPGGSSDDDGLSASAQPQQQSASHGVVDHGISSKRELKESTYLDEDGFIVTEKAWIEQTREDGADEKHKKAHGASSELPCATKEPLHPDPAKVTKAVHSKKVATKKGALPPAKQRNLFTFFSKS